MIQRTFGIVRLFAATLLLPMAGGCFHETWTYRAVPNINVARAQALGSQGPLILLSLDDLPQNADQPKRRSGAQMMDSLTADQIAHFDSRMLELNRDAAASYQNLKQARSKFGTDDANPQVASAKAAADKANKAVEDYVREYRAAHREKVTGHAVAPSTASPTRDLQAPQTVLMGNVQRDLGERGSSISRTFVLFIDGEPRPGKYWMTSDNTVLITYSAWSPPARSRIGLTGSVEIFKVEGNKIYSHVALHETMESDSTEFISHYWDPAAWQTPWVMNGKHTFIITSKDDPAFDKAAVHWAKVDEERTASSRE